MSQEKRTFKFSVGGLWENEGWEIRLNETVGLYFNHPACPHCVTVREADRCHIVMCPRVVVSHQDGGGTGVCLDCILEAAAQLPTA